MDDIKQTGTQEKSQFEKIGLAIFLALYALTFIFSIPRMIFDGEVILWIQVGAYAVLGISGVYLFRGMFLVGFQKLKTAPFKSIFWLLGAYIVYMFAVQLASLPAYLMNLDAPQNDSNVIVAVQMLGIPLSILIIGFAGPVVEEIIYRGFLIQKRKIPLWICIIFSSILFAFVHMHGFSLMDFAGALPFFAVGIVYGILYTATRNITLPIMLHVLNNTILVILLNSM